MNIFKEYYIRFRHWMRYNPPNALSSTGWGQFNREFSERAPIRWYFCNTFYSRYIRPVKHRYHGVKTWFYYRFKEKYHILKTGKPPGYAPVDEQMICACFNIVVNMVETRYACYEYWETEEYNKLNWFQCKLFNSKKLKRPELGLKYLNWMSTLDDPNLPPHERSPERAAFSREVIALYNWWTVEKDKWEPDPKSNTPAWIQYRDYENEYFSRLIKIRHHFDD